MDSLKKAVNLYSINYLRKMLFPFQSYSFFFLVYAVVVLLTRPFTGKLMDLKGANIISYPGLLLFAAGMLLLAIANSGVIFLLAAVLIGLGYGNFQSCTQAIAIKLTPIERM